MKLAIFDFDGTITRGDSFIHFTLFTHGPLRAGLTYLILSPFIILFLLKKLPNGRLKEYALTSFYNGLRESEFQTMAQRFAQEKLPSMMKQSALDRISWHKSQGHRVVVVSASPENYLKEWCAPRGIDLIATKLQLMAGNITGLLDGKNCHGEEKVRRLKEKYNLKDFEYIYAYGDTEGDRALQAIANEFHYQNFK